MGSGATRFLSEGLVELASARLDPAVIEAAERSLLNVVGTAIGASRSDAVEAVLAYARSSGALGSVPIPGRIERVAPTISAQATGVAAHYDDFDDTHLETVIHPAAVCYGALLAVGVPEGSSGAEALTAFTLGIEGQLRTGAAMSPSHYDAGWHITGTCGVLGAAITAGLLLHLDADGLEVALGIAASMTVGVREGFGTMTKPYHPGRAAANGVLGARLAAAGATGPRRILERERGFTDVLAAEVDFDRITRDLGTSWELFGNTFKPYPCGIVCHPAIYAATELSSRLPADVAIEEVVVRCHSLVPELTGNPDPRDGLQARFSTIHGVCAGLADGTVALAQYADERVRRKDLIQLRARTRLEADAAVDRDSAVLEVTLADGSSRRQIVDHAPGSLARPLTRDELYGKVESLVEAVSPGSTDAVVAAVRALRTDPDLSRFCGATCAGTATDRSER